MNKVIIDCMCNDLPFTRTTTNDISKCHFTSFTHQVLEILLVWADKAKKKRAVDQGKRRFDFRETLCCPSNILPNKKGKREKKGSRRTSIQKEKGGVGPKANTNRPNGNNKRGPSKIESHFVTLVFIIPLLFCGPIAMIRTCQLVPLGIFSTKRR